MKGKLRLMRALLVLGFAMLVLAPTSALAHDNLGGDELAATNWMLIGAFVVILMGLLAGIWAFTSGQFSNVEESKYHMIELSEDYDAVMAEADERERAAQAAADEAAQAAERRPQSEPAIPPGKSQGRPADGALQAKL